LGPPGNRRFVEIYDQNEEGEWTVFPADIANAALWLASSESTNGLDRIFKATDEGNDLASDGIRVTNDRPTLSASIFG
jgi:hypothetical protein